MSTQITTGSFTNVASTPFFVPLSQQIDQFFLWNLTRSGVTAGGVAGSLTSDRIIEARYSRYMGANTGLIKQQGTVSGNLAPLSNGNLAQNGFRLFNAADQTPGAQIAISSFTPGATTVWTTGSAHGLLVGDNVRVGSLTTAPEFGGVVMTVTAVGSPTTFTTLLVSTGHLTSVGFVYKVGNAYLPQPSLYYPQWRAIASISLANPMVVKTLVRQVYQIGDKVRFAIPTAFGLVQLNSTTNGLPVEFTVSAVNNAVGTQTITFENVNSTAFTAFAWPVAASYPYGLPVMIPQGEGNTNNFISTLPSPLPYGNQAILGFARQNQGQNGILIGAGDGTNATSTGGIIGSTVDVWEWMAVSSMMQFP